MLPMSCEGISGFTRAYSGLFGDTDAVVDIHVDGSLHVGKNHARCYAVCDETFLPEGNIESYVRDESLPPAASQLYHPLMEQLGHVPSLQPHRQPGHLFRGKREAALPDLHAT